MAPPDLINFDRQIKMIGEGRMEREKVSTFAAKFKKAFSEGLLNELGKGTRYVIGCGSSLPIEWS
jgi:hypothetical protein